MSEFAAVLAVVLLEVLLLAAIFLGYRRWRRRRMKRHQTAAHDPSLDPVIVYLDWELQKAAGLAQGPSPVGEQKDRGWERLVALRQVFLSSELNAIPLRDDAAAFWSLLGDRYAELMGDMGAAPEQCQGESAPEEAAAPEKVVEKVVYIPDGADLDNLRAVINRQDSAIDTLKDKLWESLEDQEALKLFEDKFQILQTQRKEMENCLRVLEDENNRLYGELTRLQANAGEAAEPEEAEIKPVEQRERSPGEEQHQIIAQVMTLIGKLPLSEEAGGQVEIIRETLHELLDTNTRFDKYVAEIEAENQALRRRLEGPAEDRRA